MTLKTFLLVPAAPPKRAGRGKSNFYPTILDEFLKSKEPSMMVTETGRKPSTLYIGLGKAIKENDPAIPVKVRRSGEDVYLVRTDTDEKKSRK